MKLLQYTLLLFFVFTAYTLFGQNKMLPNATVKTLSGEPVDVRDYAKDGKITVISFWATWCAPCKKELDAIADVYEDWQADYNVELVAISIDTRRALAGVPSLVSSKGWEYTILTGEATQMQNAFNFQTIPQTFLVNQDGYVVYHHNGYVPGDEDDLEEKIKELASK